MHRIGTAGWSIPRQYDGWFPGEGSQLVRYGRKFSAVEINSSFYRPHKRSTYERWALSVPASFRFAVKLPKEITHVRKLIDAIDPIERFLDEIGGLGDRLGPILVQLPPSLRFEKNLAEGFFAAMRSRFGGQIACEPRHPSWFDGTAEATLIAFRIARVAADPALVPAAGIPGGSPELAYFRLHGSPRTYYSAYGEAELAVWADAMRGGTAARPNWCIFDNTALGEATGNAGALMARL